MRKINIEALLTWAFTEELCKVGSASTAPLGYSSGGSGIVQTAAYGTTIDVSPNIYGVVPGFVYQGEPSPSAIIVGNAVRGLADLQGFEVATGWRPFPDWMDPQGLVQDEVDRTIADLSIRTDRMNGRHVVNLVINCAIMKCGPDWRAKEPRTMQVIGENGRALWFVTRSAKDRTGKTYHYEDNGYDRIKKRPMKGAFRKWRLEHPVRAAILNRMDWQLWQSALEVLYESLSSRQEFSGMAAFAPDRHPWKRGISASKSYSSI